VPTRQVQQHIACIFQQFVTATKPVRGWPHFSLTPSAGAGNNRQAIIFPPDLTRALHYRHLPSRIGFGICNYLHAMMAAATCWIEMATDLGRESLTTSSVALVSERNGENRLALHPPAMIGSARLMRGRAHADTDTAAKPLNRDAGEMRRHPLCRIATPDELRDVLPRPQPTSRTFKGWQSGVNGIGHGTSGTRQHVWLSFTCQKHQRPENTDTEANSTFLGGRCTRTA
jgi:hypothetical protein